MANEEQLEILKQGVEVWNRGQDHHRTQVDLSQANLTEANLTGADLIKADLRGANLAGANLTGADLRQADLSEADLREANLTEANLGDVYLPKADLRGANLAGANLRQANLSKANLTGANLSKADLREADLRQANLRGANLNEAKLSSSFLYGADLSRTNLSGTDFSGTDFSGADFDGSDFDRANFCEANLSDANLSDTNLHRIDFREANLSRANLHRADLSEADLNGANLTGTDLSRAILVGTKIDKAKISGCSIYAVNVWDLEGEFAEQKDLVITPDGDPLITVDNIKVAQFIYLILNNEEIRDVINTLTSKSVLILGRFAIPERKAILDALRNKLREYNLLPIVFDFDRPTDKDFTETIKTLAGLCYFVIADVTNPKSSPLELQATVPDYQIPFVPIIQEGEYPFAMMVDLQKKYNWVLDTLSYKSIDDLIKALKPAIIDPAVAKHNELRLIKAREPKIRSASDFIDDKGLDD